MLFSSWQLCLSILWSTSLDTSIESKLLQKFLAVVTSPTLPPTPQQKGMKKNMIPVSMPRHRKGSKYPHFSFDSNFVQNFRPFYESSFRLIPPTPYELCLVGISLLISTNPFMPTSHTIFAIHYTSICFYQSQSHISISFPLWEIASLPNYGLQVVFSPAYPFS